MSRATELPPPPRAVPWSLRLRVMNGGALAVIGWAMLAAGGLFATVFVGNSELVGWYRFATELATTDGEVVDAAGTHMRTNSRAVLRVGFRYQVDGRELRGVAYCESRAPAAGAPVVVEYAVQDPEVARVRGMRTHPFPSAVAFVLLLPLIGAALLAIGRRRGSRRVALLRDGRAATGTLQSRERTSTKINNRYVYELCFAFVDERGQQRTARDRTHRPEFFEEGVERQLLYDEETEDSCLVALIPGRPRPSPYGWEPLSAGQVALALALPLAVVVATVAGSYVLD